MYKILTLNNISVAGLERLPRERYEVASEIQHPDAILLRSFKMHSMDIPETLKAVGRAGAGVNNIPVDEMSQRGIPVFNAPGANSNAVHELVLAGMLLASRNICQGWEYARNLTGDDGAIHRQVESGKKDFVGFELPGRTLGVVGLGAIGIKIANSALKLGMKVIGFDPQITVQSAWKLSSDVQLASSLDDLLIHSDFVTFHVPLVDATRSMLGKERFDLMKPGATVLNFSRDGIIDNDALSVAIKADKIHAYVCDFPSNLMKDHERVITLPHLGASTIEAEENCAVMVADQVRDFLESGNIFNAVNFPEIQMPRSDGAYRIGIFNSNVPNMVGQISTTLADAGLNIVDLLNKSKGEYAYTLVDLESEIPQSVMKALDSIDGVLAVRSY